MNMRDREIIRELAKKYMAFATSEKQQKVNQRMQNTNDLIFTRPPVLIDEVPWYQMNMDHELTCICEDEAARAVEYDLRIRLYRIKHFACDELFYPFWPVSMTIEATSNGLQRKENILRTDDENNIMSHELLDTLQDEEALSKMVERKYTVRPDIDEGRMNFYTDLFGDAMPVKLIGHACYGFAPWDDITYLRGITPILYDMYDRPEFLHAIMQKFVDQANGFLDFVEQNSHVTPEPLSLHCTPAQVSGLANDGWKATWFRTMAQSFGSISPEMHEEFDVAYSKEMSKRFAYTYYGCCEPLDNKIDMLKRNFANLRKIGVSPWANVEVCAEQIGKDFVLSRKPNPANVAVKTDPEVIRKEIEETVKLCFKYGCPCDIVLKDISNVSHRPENLIVWSKTVKEVLDQYYGEE